MKIKYLSYLTHLIFRKSWPNLVVQIRLWPSLSLKPRSSSIDHNWKKLLNLPILSLKASNLIQMLLEIKSNYCIGGPSATSPRKITKVCRTSVWPRSQQSSISSRRQSWTILMSLRWERMSAWVSCSTSRGASWRRWCTSMGRSPCKRLNSWLRSLKTGPTWSSTSIWSSHCSAMMSTNSVSSARMATSNY